MQGSTIAPKGLFIILALALAVAAQHDHSHSHHGEVKSEWDEEEYLKSNPPTPPSYWSEDTRMRMNPDEDLPARYPWLMVLHILFMSGAFFVALPAGEFLVITVDLATFPGLRISRCLRESLGAAFPTPTYVPVPFLGF